MADRHKVKHYLGELKTKINIFGILFRDDRGKNQQTLATLEISPLERKEIIKALKPEDYSEGPLEEKLHGMPDMWVFGKNVRGHEVYIKISMGTPNNEAVCISFHLAGHPITYPLKNQQL